MADKLQLENAGDSASMTIVEVKSVATKFGDKVVFVGVDDDGHAWETPLISDTTADKQLDRLGLDRQSCVAETLTFSRAANPTGKPYWNIEPANGRSSAPSKRMTPTAAAAPKAKAAPTNASARREQLTSDYCKLLKFVKANGGLGDDVAVQAAAATIWISWKNHGVQASAIEEKPVEAAPPIPTTPPPSGKRIAAPAKIPDSLPEAFHDDDLPF